MENKKNYKNHSNSNLEQIKPKLIKMLSLKNG